MAKAPQIHHLLINVVLRPGILQLKSSIKTVPYHHVELREKINLMLSPKNKKKGKSSSSKRVSAEQLSKVIQQIMVESKNDAVINIMTSAFQYALNAKFGNGLIAQQMITVDEFDSTFNHISPLTKIIELEIERVVKTSFSIALSDPISKEYFAQKFTSLEGKKGGRPVGNQPHIRWLKDQIIAQDSRYSLRGLTVKEHFQELSKHPELQPSEEDNGLEFLDTRGGLLDSWGEIYSNGSPIIKQSTIQIIYTKLRKNPIDS